MTNYSPNAGHVRCSRFKESGKWYDDFVIDMSTYYNEPLIHSAVAQAIQDAATDRWDPLNDDFWYVVMEPYHVNSHPIMMSGHSVKRELSRTRSGVASQD